MTSPIDLEPAAARLAGLIEGLAPDALEGPTPCERFTVGDLLDHIGRFALAFRATAVKDPLPRPPAADAANLDADWRSRIPGDLLAMAEAWRDPEAWRGMTAAGGIDLPGEVAGVVALDELVIHGWDLARATGRPSGYDGPGLEAVFAAVQHFRTSGIDGLFGPEVPVAEDAPLLDRTLGVAGRDPDWQPPGAGPQVGRAT